MGTPSEWREGASTKTLGIQLSKTHTDLHNYITLFITEGANKVLRKGKNSDEMLILIYRHN